MKYLFTIILFLFSIQFSLAQDKPNGPFKEYYDSGELQIEGQYQSKKRIGTWKSYHKNGQVRSLYSYKNGKQNKDFISYYEDGSIKSKTEKEDGEYINSGYYESGNLKYKREIKSGYYKSYYESGAKDIEANYFEYDLVGEWKKYYTNGQIEWLVFYKNGYREGFYKKYYENGDLELEGNNIRDKVNGKEKRYLQGNLLEWEGNYSKGKLNSTWVKYDEKGKKTEKIKFKDGIASKAEFKDLIEPTKVAKGVFETIAIYPGCEEMLTNKTRKKCMNQNIAKFIAKNFNTNIAVANNITGRQKIYVIFKIDKEGKPFDIKARNKHDILKLEAIRVINNLPKLQPGYQKGKPVIMPFTIPIVFNVQ